MFYNSRQDLWTFSDVLSPGLHVRVLTFHLEELSGLVLFLKTLQDATELCNLLVLVKCVKCVKCVALSNGGKKTATTFWQTLPISAQLLALNVNELATNS